MKLVHDKINSINNQVELKPEQYQESIKKRLEM